MSPAIPSVTSRDIVRALGKLGFRQVSTRGSHAKLAHSDGRQAGISPTEFVKHL